MREKEKRKENVMNIGIDLDGVIFDSEKWFRVESCFYNEKLNDKDMINPEEIKAFKRYDWSKEQENIFLQEVLIEIEKNAPLMYKAKEVIDYFQSCGHKIYIITSRGLVFPEEIKISLDRLKCEGINYEKFIHSTEDKERVCSELGIDVMIDDYYDFAKKISEHGIKCLYFRGDTLKTINHPNVIEVRNWGDIYIEIKKLCKTKK